ncbi:hypothetical protein PHMEG_00024631 [Phytophthora megakarya]|uniref:Nuclease HARBI1 n=1 Tax=Phytophthora megakarya TaxID=4795 RepID=A0A225VD69_9STRA|nr:hypothetical protein PHMEG_00024631 [Phytophthora megakarya]
MRHERIHHNAKIGNHKRVAVSLVYLSTSSTIDSAASLLGMSKSNAVMYINQVLKALQCSVRHMTYMPHTEAEIIFVRTGFERIAGFPDVVGLPMVP